MKTEEDEEVLSCMSKISVSIVTFLETIFYRHGKFVSSRPISVMVAMIVLCAVCTLGFLNLHMESKPERLWIPQDSDFIKTVDWQKKNYPDNYRLELVLFYAENVLQPEYIKEMFYTKQEIDSIVVSDSLGRNRSREDMCLRVPALGGASKHRLDTMKASFQKQEGGSVKVYDWSQTLNRDIYCQFFERMPTACLYMGILDIWPNNVTVIESLTHEEVIQAVNSATESASYGIPLNFTSLMGGISRNSSGQIVGAKSFLHLWSMEIDRDQVKDQKTSKLSTGFTTEMNEDLYNWEGEFVDRVMDRKKIGLPEGLTVWPLSARSLLEVSENTIFGDIKYLTAGFMLLLIFVTLMLGKFNMVETRTCLSSFGLASIYLSIFMSYGICAGFGIVYGPIHNILMLLLIGLGVDDMFVLVDSLDNLNKSEQPSPPLSIEEKMARTLSTAGVSITVTSLTDFMAFAIGSTTALPALRSFCIYAALGVLCLYLMQITFFFAALTLDQTRMEAHRNGFFWCIKHRDWQPNQCSQTNYSQTFFEKVLAKLLLTPVGKTIVLVITAVFTSLCIWGVTNLKQEFNIIWFIPKTSYVSKFMLSQEEYFPELGNAGSVYIEHMDLPRELPNLKWLTDSMRENRFISTVESWYDPLVTYTLSDTGVNLNKNVSEEFFADAFGKFLFSPNGTKFQTYIYFNETLSCDGKAPPIMAYRINYRHHIISDRNEQIQAMDEMKALVKSANFSGFTSCTSLSYNDWETNKLIVKEVIQNLSLALVAVFFMTTLLIVNLRASLLVLFSVLLTLTDVMALMYWWDLTIDTVTCINLVLCIGLSVDYSVHVALHFMKVEGTRDERVTRTLAEVGPPVFNGAFSTFLSIVLLANSDSHVFESFFKILFGVFIYGVYHGLVLLPVLLSLVGPPPYKKRNISQDTSYTSKAKVEKGTEFTIYSFSS